MDLLSTGLTGFITLLAAFGGISLGGVNQRRADERAAAREEVRHRREVTARLEEDRRRDQLVLMRTVQEETVETARTVLQLLFANEDLRQEGGDDSALADHIRPDLYEARTALALHASRLLDDDLREALDAFQRNVLDAAMHSSVVPDSGTAEEASRADRGRAAMIDRQHEQIMAALGVAIRAEVLKTISGAT